MYRNTFLNLLEQKTFTLVLFLGAIYSTDVSLKITKFIFCQVQFRHELKLKINNTNEDVFHKSYKIFDHVKDIFVSYRLSSVQQSRTNLW